jgi:hypothetical protein
MLHLIADSVAAAPNHVVLVDNWFKELKAKVKQ